MNFSRVIQEATGLLFDGLKITIAVSLIAIVFGLLIGFLTYIMKASKNIVLRAIASTYVWIIRATPMMVQAFVIYFGLPQVIQQFSPSFRIDSFTASVITLALNCGAYMSEIFRGAINAVPNGQIEASRSLGVSSSKTMLKIVIPQALKIAIPSLVNQFIITVKDTSILSVIGLADLVNKAKGYVGSTYQFFATYILVGVYYLVFISILMVISNQVEKRFNYDKKRHY